MRGFPKDKKKYVIVYRYSKSGMYTWESFNYLEQVRTYHYYNLKWSSNFRIFVLKGDKYITLLGKKRFVDLIMLRLINTIKNAEHKDKIMNNMTAFRQKLEKSLSRIS